MTRLKVYVAGPYTKGDVAVNVKRALDAGQQLAEWGFVPFVPHLTHFWHLQHPRDYDWWMGYDMEWLTLCHALLRLPGDSLGADAEVRHALASGIPVFHTIGAVREWARSRHLEQAA